MNDNVIKIDYPKNTQPSRQQDNAVSKQSPQSPLQQILKLVEDDLVCVNHMIIDKMHSSVSMIPELAGYLVASGGKRIRPLLTLAGANLCGYVGTRHINLATCVEFIHTATLLHDDVVDESVLRRGQKSASTIWGNQASVLVGDFLFSRAFQLMVSDGSLRVLKILSDASAKIAEGEVLQLQIIRKLDSSEAQYMEMIIAKTATLFEAAARVPAIISESSEQFEQALGEYGTNLGIAFQLSDDVLDYQTSSQKLGKEVGDDFREGKLTLPVLLAWRRCTQKQQSFWNRTICDGNLHDGDLDQAIEMMQHYDVFEDCLSRARHFATVADDALQVFPHTPMRKALSQLAYYCVDRYY
ncbi:MAG: polyprenyl synthetase family protein [Pseudomonadota bacterium]